MKKIDSFKLIMVYALLLSLLRLYSSLKFSFLLLNLHLLSLFSELLDVNLGTQIAVRIGARGSTSQLLESLQVLVGEGVRTDRTEWSRGTSARGEELKAC